jgi:hypothetical protein
MVKTKEPLSEKRKNKQALNGFGSNIGHFVIKVIGDETLSF